LCLQDDGHATFEDHTNFSHLFIVVGTGSAVFTSMGFLGHRCYWWWHLLAIQKRFALFQIVSYGMMDLTPLLCVSRVME
jgi:hypothetical protein